MDTVTRQRGRFSEPTPDRPTAPAVAGAIVILLLVSAADLSPGVISVGGGCALDDAISSALAGTPVGGCRVEGDGEVVIELTGNVELTRVNNEADGANGLPSVTGSVRVEGNGFAIRRADSAPDFRIFHVATNGTLTLNDVTIENGRFYGGFLVDDGAGIFNRGHLSMTGGAIIDNRAFGYYGTGGGIRTGGTVELTNTLVSDNSADFGGGLGGGGSVTLVDSTITENSRGIALTGGSLTLVGSTVANNDDGDQFSPGGAGLFSEDGTVVIVNSTFSGNEATYGPSAIEADGGTITIVNSTVSGNEDIVVGSLAAIGGSNFPASTIVLANSIVADNFGPNCGNAVVDGGNNFDDDGSCPGAGAIVPDVDFSTRLADNGGPTTTHALLPGSVAADAAGDCGLPTDQRGYTRVGVGCDSGSYELDGRPPPQLTIAGACPGPVQLTVDGATPAATIAILASATEGRAQLPAGPCAGTEVTLDQPRLRATLLTDDNGRATIDFDAGAPLCQAAIQAVDLATCAVSEVAGFQ